MLKKLILAILILVPAARSACASEIEMRAGSIRTWTRDEVQTFLLEGQARITGEQGSFSADTMVVWLDRAQAKKSGVVQIMVYSESAGAAGITQITGASRLVLDKGRAHEASGGKRRAGAG